MARILLTGGRAPVTLDLARAFHKQGHEVFVAESQSAQLSRSSRAVKKTFLVPPPRTRYENYIQALSDLIQSEQIDLLIPTCEEVFYVAKGADRLKKLCRVFVDDFEKLNRLHSKWEFNQWAGEMGLNTPESYLIQAVPELAQHAEKKGLWILKPAFSRFGVEVYKGPIEKLLKMNLNISKQTPWVLQKCITGREVCAYAIAEDGKLLALSLYDHEFVAGRAGICFEEIDPTGLSETIGEFVKNISFTGQIAFDFIREDGKFFAIECNPRATSGVHLLTTAPRFTEVFTQQESFVRAEIGQRAMLLLAMLSFGLPQIHSFRKLLAWMKFVCTGREVIFSFRDPRPFFDQLICLSQLVIQARRRKINVLAMSTLDIEWNGS